MDKESLQELKENFEHFDRDGNGRIDFGEFMELMDALEAGIEPAEGRIGFDSIDVDGSGRIEFEEFHAWWSGR